MKQTPVHFFEIPLDRFEQRQLEDQLAAILDGSGQALIATPNPEMLLAASRDDEIARVLRRMHLRIPDGVGTSIMARLTGQGHLQRFPGVDVFLDVCRLAAKRKMHVLLLGGWGKDAAVAGRVLETAFPGLRVSTYGDIQIRYEEGEWEQPGDLLDRVRSLQPDIVGVALGGGLYERQERWIADHVPGFSSVKLAIGIGGAIDMISGRTSRAPGILCAVGCEWIWRLLRDSRRLPRVINAVIRFPIAVFLDRLRARDV